MIFYIRLAAHLISLLGLEIQNNTVGILENWCFESWGEIRCVTRVTEVDWEDKRILDLWQVLCLVMNYTIGSLRSSNIDVSCLLWNPGFFNYFIIEGSVEILRWTRQQGSGGNYITRSLWSVDTHTRTHAHTHTHTRAHTHTHTHAHTHTHTERVISPSQRRLPKQQTQQTNFHALRDIRTRDPSNQASTELRLRPHCHRDGQE